MLEPELGVIVTSRAGHDKGRAFVIVGREGSEHLRLADGKTRRIEQPKKKKLRHVHIEPHIACGIREQLAAGKPVQNAELAKALSALGYNTDAGK